MAFVEDLGPILPRRANRFVSRRSADDENARSEGTLSGSTKAKRNPRQNFSSLT
jgi:hypothetical protein